MGRLLLACGCIAALAATTAAAADTKRPTGLSAAQIAARNVKARGGLAAWREPSSGVSVVVGEGCRESLVHSLVSVYHSGELVPLLHSLPRGPRQLPMLFGKAN